MNTKLLLLTLLVSTSTLAQSSATGTTGNTLEVTKPMKRYTGININFKVALQMRDVLNLFKEDGYDLELNGATQTVIVDAYDFRRNKKLPQNAAAIAMGTNNDTGINIWVNIPIWESMSYEKQMITLLHELGHDYFNLKHTEDKKDLMYFELPRGYVNMNDVRQYYNQLKELCRNR